MERRQYLRVAEGEERAQPEGKAFDVGFPRHWQEVNPEHAGGIRYLVWERLSVFQQELEDAAGEMEGLE